MVKSKFLWRQPGGIYSPRVILRGNAQRAQPASRSWSVTSLLESRVWRRFFIWRNGARRPLTASPQAPSWRSTTHAGPPGSGCSTSSRVATRGKSKQLGCHAFRRGYTEPRNRGTIILRRDLRKGKTSRSATLLPPQAERKALARLREESRVLPGTSSRCGAQSSSLRA